MRIESPANALRLQVVEILHGVAVVGHARKARRVKEALRKNHNHVGRGLRRLHRFAFLICLPRLRRFVRRQRQRVDFVQDFPHLLRSVVFRRADFLQEQFAPQADRQAVKPVIGHRRQTVRHFHMKQSAHGARQSGGKQAERQSDGR